MGDDLAINSEASAPRRGVPPAPARRAGRCGARRFLEGLHLSHQHGGVREVPADRGGLTTQRCRRQRAPPARLRRGRVEQRSKRSPALRRSPRSGSLRARPTSPSAGLPRRPCRLLTNAATARLNVGAAAGRPRVKTRARPSRRRSRGRTGRTPGAFSTARETSSRCHPRLPAGRRRARRPTHRDRCRAPGGRPASRAGGPRAAGATALRRHGPGRTHLALSRSTRASPKSSSWLASAMATRPSASSKAPALEAGFGRGQSASVRRARPLRERDRALQERCSGGKASACLRPVQRIARARRHLFVRRESGLGSMPGTTVRIDPGSVAAARPGARHDARSAPRLDRLPSAEVGDGSPHVRRCRSGPLPPQPRPRWWGCPARARRARTGGGPPPGPPPPREEDVASPSGGPRSFGGSSPRYDWAALPCWRWGNHRRAAADWPAGSSSRASGLPRASAMTRSRTDLSIGPSVADLMSSAASCSDNPSRRSSGSPSNSLGPPSRSAKMMATVPHAAVWPRMRAPGRRTGPATGRRRRGRPRPRLSMLCQLAQESQADEEAVGRAARAEAEGCLQRLSLRCRQSLEAVEQRTRELMDRREGQLHL